MTPIKAAIASRLLKIKTMPEENNAETRCSSEEQQQFFRFSTSELNRSKKPFRLLKKDYLQVLIIQTHWMTYFERSPISIRFLCTVQRLRADAIFLDT